MSVDVKFLEEVIQNLVEFRSRLSEAGDIQVYDAALAVAEDHLQVLESDD